MKKSHRMRLVAVLLACFSGITSDASFGAEECTLNVAGAVKTPLSLSIKDLEGIGVREERMKVGTPPAEYRGAYGIRGVSLTGILEKAVCTKNEDDGFNRELDMFVTVHGRDGSWVAFSWGELFAGNGGNRILLVTGKKFLFPHKHSAIATDVWDCGAWIPGTERIGNRLEKAGCLTCHVKGNQVPITIPEGFCLVCLNDNWLGRFVEDVVEIRVGQIPPIVRPTFKPLDKDTMFVATPTLSFLDGTTKAIGTETLAGLSPIVSKEATFGMGKGFHGIHTMEGIPLSRLFQGRPDLDQWKHLLVLVTGGDGYRSVFSGGEIMGSHAADEVRIAAREDGRDEGPGYGRFKLFSVSDFFVDRSIRTVAEIRCFVPEIGDKK